MKKTIIHSSVFLLNFLLTACNNNDTGSKTKSVEYAEIGLGQYSMNDSMMKRTERIGGFYK